MAASGIYWRLRGQRTRPAEFPSAQALVQIRDEWEVYLTDSSILSESPPPREVREVRVHGHTNDLTMGPSTLQVPQDDAQQSTSTTPSRVKIDR